MDNKIDRKIDVTAILFLLVQNRQQTHDWTLVGSGANGLGIQECIMAELPLVLIGEFEQWECCFLKKILTFSSFFSSISR